MSSRDDDDGDDGCDMLPIDGNGQLDSVARKYTSRSAADGDLSSHGDQSDASHLFPNEEGEEASSGGGGGGGRVHRGAVITSHKQATKNNNQRLKTAADDDQQHKSTRGTLLQLERYIADEVPVASEDTSHASALQSLNSEQAHMKRKKLIYESYLNYAKNHSREYSKDDGDELAEQWAAQVIIEAINISHAAIEVGVRASIGESRQHGVRSRYEMNMMKKRDFHISKPSKEPVKTVTSLDDDLERHGRANYGALDAELNSYLRDYRFTTYEAARKGVHPKKSNFKFIETLDLSNLLMGDQRLIELCDNWSRCPAHTLVLSNNHLTPASVKVLSQALRGFPSLTCLNLSRNELTDKAVELLFEKTSYSPILTTVNLQFNPLTPEAAYHLGQMFLPDRSSALRHLYLGGALGKKGFGDEFIRVLVSFLTSPDCRPIETLHFPEGNLTDDGINALAALVACSNSLRVVNMSKNSLVSQTVRALLLAAIRVNRSVEHFYVRQCGLTKLERNRFEAAVRFSSQLTWHELSFTALLTARIIDDCARLRHRLEVKVTNKWDAPPPPAWPDNLGVRDGEWSLTEMPMVEGYLSQRARARLLPPEVAGTLRHLLGFYPLLDMLMLACNKADEYLSDISRDAILRRGSAGTAAGANKVAVEVSRSRERRREIVGMRRVVMQTVTDIYIKAVQEELAAAKTASTGWNRSVAQKKVFTEQHVGMACEDYLSSVWEYSVSLEQYVGLLHQHRLGVMQREPKRFIAYYAHLRVAGAYTHFVYSEWPAEELRRRLIVERLARDEEIRQLKETRTEKLKGSSKSGKRFDIRAYASMDPGLRPPRKLITRHVRSDYSSTTQDDDSATIATLGTVHAAQAAVDFLIEEEEEGDATPATGEEVAVVLSPLVIVQKPTAADEMAARLAALASGQLQEEEEELGSVHYATKYRPSVQRQKDFEALSTLVVTSEQLHQTKFALNRSSRRYHVRPVGVPVTVVNLPSGAAQPACPVFYLEEDERSEALRSLKDVDCTRMLATAEDRFRIRQYERIASRAADLQLK